MKTKISLNFLFLEMYFILLSSFLYTCTSTSVSAFTSTPKTSASELVIFNWADYMDPQVIKEFEKEFKCHVKQLYFESDKKRNELLMTTQGKGYDLVLVSNASLGLFFQQGWIAPLDNKIIENSKLIDKRFWKLSKVSSKYSIPYFWGTVGIAYREDLLGEKIDSWKDIYTPKNQKLKNKIMMVSDSDLVIEMALKMLGFSTNSSKESEYHKVETVLLNQRPFVKAYSYISNKSNSELVTGEVWIAMIFNGDAAALKEFSPHIKYIVPKEGTNLWVDSFVLMKSSSHKQLAMKFLNFINRPPIAAKLSKTLKFATPNLEARKLLPSDLLNDQVIYPSSSILDKTEYEKDLPLEILKIRNGIFAQISTE